MNEVVIIGGSLNGLAMALALGGARAMTPLATVIVDRGDPTRLGDPGRDGRASAITATSRRMLEALGVWDALKSHAEPMRRIEVTDSPLGGARPVLLAFEEDDQPGEPTAFMVENHRLHGALAEAALRAEAIRFVGGRKVTGLCLGEAAAEVIIEGEAPMRARLVVAADGRHSPARQAAGISGTGWSYGQRASTFTIAHEHPHHGTAREHFLAAGPFAVLPLAGNRSSIVWTEIGSEEASADSEDWRERLRAHVGNDLGRIEVVSTPQAWPLELFVAERFVGPRLALIGDAAHVIHPIAGLGFNLGLRDAAALAEVVIGDARLGLDHGASGTLAHYQAWRRFDTMMVAAATDGLNRLFSNDSVVLRLLRTVGLSAVNQLKPARSAFMREAAGLTGSLPRLMTGETL